MCLKLLPFFVSQNFGSKEDTVFCGVFDGHGPYGHRVAKKVRDSFPLKLSAQWDLHCKNKDGFNDQNGAATSYNSGEQIRLVDENFDHEFDETYTISALRESYLKASKIMDKELKLHRDIDCFCSGTTAVTLIKQVSNINNNINTKCSLCNFLICFTVCFYSLCSFRGRILLSEMWEIPELYWEPEIMTILLLLFS
jgi:serine/threonine protein phosphatase PrpC